MLIKLVHLYLLNTDGPVNLKNILFVLEILAIKLQLSMSGWTPCWDFCWPDAYTQKGEDVALRNATQCGKHLGWLGQGISKYSCIRNTHHLKKGLLLNTSKPKNVDTIGPSNDYRTHHWWINWGSSFKGLLFTPKTTKFIKIHQNSSKYIKIHQKCIKISDSGDYQKNHSQNLRATSMEQNFSTSYQTHQQQQQDDFHKRETIWQNHY